MASEGQASSSMDGGRSRTGAREYMDNMLGKLHLEGKENMEINLEEVFDELKSLTR